MISNIQVNYYLLLRHKFSKKLKFDFLSISLSLLLSCFDKKIVNIEKVEMILLVCLWQTSPMQSLIAIFSWSILHALFTVSLSQLALTSHMSNCCSKKGAKIVGPCKERLYESVRGLLDLVYAATATSWGIYLLLTARLDVNSHAFFYTTSLGYYLYSSYWSLKTVGWSLRKKSAATDKQKKNSEIRKNKILHLVECLFPTAIVISALKALSSEMTRWRNTILPIMLDLQPGSNWAHPNAMQRRALSHHLMSKSSEIAWLMTLCLILHGFPNVFFTLMKLLYLSNYQVNQMKHYIWAVDNHVVDVCSAAELGATAWRRERGFCRPPGRTKSQLELVLSKLHRLSFFIVRVLGGFATLNRILMTEALVLDTAYLSLSLLHYGLAVYLFAGIISYTAKQSKFNTIPRKSLSWAIATSANDDWLRFD